MQLAKHILILTDISPSYQSDLDDVKNEIKDIITKVETQNFYNDLLNQISEKIIDGNSFKSLANSLNMDVRFVNNLTRDYNEYDESEKILYLNLIQSSFASNKDFVSDINRARVLRVRSIMTPIVGEIPADTHGEVDCNDTLESVIEKSNGDVSYSYIVMQENVPVGILNMSNLVKALVPRVASEEGARKY